MLLLFLYCGNLSVNFTFKCSSPKPLGLKVIKLVRNVPSIVLYKKLYLSFMCWSALHKIVNHNWTVWITILWSFTKRFFLWSEMQDGHYHSVQFFIEPNEKLFYNLLLRNVILIETKLYTYICFSRKLFRIFWANRAKTLYKNDVDKHRTLLKNYRIKCLS